MYYTFFMSEDTSDTSLSELNSVAEKLKAAGFHKTSIARAVTELVWEYLWIHANMGDNLVRALWKTNAGALDLLWSKQLDGPINVPAAANDSTFEVKKVA